MAISYCAPKRQKESRLQQEMVQLRFLTYLIPRVSQVFGWPVHTNGVAERLLKKEEKVKVREELPHNLYQPPPYIPPENTKQSRLKGIF